MCGDGKSVPCAGVAGFATGHPAHGAAQAVAVAGRDATAGHGGATRQPAGAVERRTRRTTQPPDQRSMADLFPLGGGRTRGGNCRLPLNDYEKQVAGQHHAG